MTVHENILQFAFGRKQYKSIDAGYYLHGFLKSISVAVYPS